MQSKKLSALESITNVIAGFLVALLTQLAIFPAMNIPVSLQENLTISLVFTVVSVIRSYVIRRIFNKIR